MSEATIPIQVEDLRAKASRELESVPDLDGLEAWRITYTGRRGQLTQLLRGLGALPSEERREAGAAANAVRAALEESLAEREDQLKRAAMEASLSADAIDVTMPGWPVPKGGLHITTRIVREICSAFASMGFTTVEGPEVEWDTYNFEKLNIPKGHPARDMWATLWIDHTDEDGEHPMLLRTHTSPNQIEGLAVDRGITLADLKGTLYEFARRIFGSERKVRFRCDYFPFVEPGVDMSIDCFLCDGVGCRVCQDTGWIEIMGAGMVHPQVLENVGYDPNIYTGFAFGMGPERVAMLKYGIEDIRLFYANDLRFLRQFA